MFIIIYVFITNKKNLLGTARKDYVWFEKKILKMEMSTFGVIKNIWYHETLFLRGVLIFDHLFHIIFCDNFLFLSLSLSSLDKNNGERKRKRKNKMIMGIWERKLSKNCHKVVVQISFLISKIDTFHMVIIINYIFLYV